MFLILGLIVLLASVFILLASIDSYSDAPMYVSIFGMVLGFVLICVGGFLADSELSRKDCEAFRAQGTEAYVVDNSCYVKMAENVFTQTRGEEKHIRPRSWVIGHKDPGQ